MPSGCALTSPGVQGLRTRAAGAHPRASPSHLPGGQVWPARGPSTGSTASGPHKRQGWVDLAPGEAGGTKTLPALLSPIRGRRRPLASASPLPERPRGCGAGPGAARFTQAHTSGAPLSASLQTGPASPPPWVVRLTHPTLYHSSVWHDPPYQDLSGHTMPFSFFFFFAWGVGWGKKQRISHETVPRLHL